MCTFFSFCGDGKGNFLYTTRAEREAGCADPDSHTAILTREGINPRYQDRWTKYEWMFNQGTETHTFCVDEPLEGHDHHAAQDWVEGLDFVHSVGYSAYYKVAIDDRKATIERYKAIIDDHKATIECYKVAIDDRKADIERYMAVIECYKADIERYMAVIECYKADIDDYKAVIERYKVAIDDRKADIERYEAKSEYWQAKEKEY